VLTPWMELAAAAGLSLALAALGVAILRLLLVRIRLLDVLALGFPVGAGIVTLFLFIASWAGVPLSIASASLSWGLLLALAFLIRRAVPVGQDAAWEKNASHGHLRGSFGWGSRIALLIMLGAAGFAAWLGIGRAYSAWDDMAIWAVKGYGIAREGTIWAAGHWGDHGLTYPLNLPLLIATFRFTGDMLPASKLIAPLFYLSLCVGCLRFWLQRDVAPLTASLGVVGLAATPILFEHATLGYANLPYTFYLVLGCGEAILGIVTGDWKRQALGSLLLGLATWTRPEGGLAVASILAVVGVAAHFARPRGVRWLAWVLPAGVVAGAWICFVSLHGTGGQIQQALGAAMGAVGRGELHPGAFYWIVRFMGRQAIELPVWGLLPLACAALLILGLRRLGPRSNPDAFLVGVALLVVAAGVTLQFYLADFLGQLMDYLGNSANRMYMPAAVLTTLLAVMLTRRSFAEDLSAAEESERGSGGRVDAGATP
jgi:hypothetical protein